LTQVQRSALYSRLRKLGIGESPMAVEQGCATAIPELGIMFFSGLGIEGNPYELLLDVAKFADTCGFKAVWTPERHFTAVGGAYPNPSILAAALATVTSKVKLRAGSITLPLHDPIRVAEEWAVVD